LNVLSSPRTARSRPSRSTPATVAAEHVGMAFGVGTPFLGLLAAILLSWGGGVGWTDLLLLSAFYCVTLLGITIGFHRMFTHRALQGGPALRFVLGVAGSMAAQGSVLEWCAVHRQHHKHSDRHGDPHSPHLHRSGWCGMLRGMWHSHLGWLFSADAGATQAAVPDLLADPVLRFVDRFFWLWMLTGWAIPAIVAGLLLRSWTAALSGFIWGGLVRTFLLHHVTWSVNSVCHVWGAREFHTGDQSRNNWLFGIVAFGEGWHNNHHAFPTSARHGLRWWEADLTYLVIRGMKWVGLVSQVRVPTPAAIEAKRQDAALAT